MLRSFSRSQVSALIATMIDYAILSCWVEILHLHYPYGVALGSAAGAISNFWINRQWSFMASKSGWRRQAARYAIVSTGSLVLNTAGVTLLTEFRGFHYLVSQVFISVFVGLFFNFPLHRYYVYKKKECHHERAIHFSASKSENTPEDFDSRAPQSSIV